MLSRVMTRLSAAQRLSVVLLPSTVITLPSLLYPCPRCAALSRVVN